MIPLKMTPLQARHLLVRTGFAPTQTEVDKIVGHSAQRAVADILAAAAANRPKYAAPDFASQSPPTP